MSSTMSDTKAYTYAELAAALGTGVPSVRNLVRRKRWARVNGNDKLARILVPVDYVEKERQQPAPTGGMPHAAQAAAQDAPQETALMVLTRHIERLEAELEPLRSVEAQVAALQATLEAVREERDHLRARRGFLARLLGAA
jgi:hypothetical protein